MACDTPGDGRRQVFRHALAFLEVCVTPAARRGNGNEARRGNGAKTRVPLPSAVAVVFAAAEKPTNKKRN